MNAVYHRYRTDERFRAAVLAKAHRARAQAMACLFAGVVAWLLAGSRRRVTPVKRTQPCLS